MRFSILILFLTFQQLSVAQEFPLRIKITSLTSDTVDYKFENRNLKNFSNFKSPYNSGDFYFEGPTLNTPYSPVFRWHLYLNSKEYIQIYVTDEHDQLVAPSLSDSLVNGVYRIELENLWNQKEMLYYFIEIKSALKTTKLKFLFLGRDILIPYEHGLTIKDLNSSNIISDSLSLLTTINSNTKTHLKGWILNVTEHRQFTFKLINQSDSSWVFFETRHLKPGLYEINLDPSITSGKYRLLIESYDAKLEEVFTLIR